MNIVKKTILALGLGGFLVVTNAQQSMNDPFYEDFRKMQNDMDMMFINFHKKYFHENDFSTNNSIQTDYKETNSSYIIQMNLPGYQNSNIKISHKKQLVTIDAKQQSSNEQKSKELYKQEQYAGSIYQSFTLPNNADLEKLKDEFKNGMLTITIPKK
jgi:HSP20 family protein